MTAARSDSIAVFEVQARSKYFPAHPRSWVAYSDIAIARPSVSESLSFQQVPSESNGDMNLRDVIRYKEARTTDTNIIVLRSSISFARKNSEYGYG